MTPRKGIDLVAQMLVVSFPPGQRFCLSKTVIDLVTLLAIPSDDKGCIFMCHVQHFTEKICWTTEDRNIK